MGRINAFRVIERPERMNILGDQNTESVKQLAIYSVNCYINVWHFHVRIKKQNDVSFIHYTITDKLYLKIRILH